MPRVSLTISGLRFNAVAKSMLSLIIFAYNVKDYQIIRTPALQAVGDTFYDIAAKAEGDHIPTTDEFRQMLKGLLIDRFKLQAHPETRETPVYALTIGKNGPNFRESRPDAKAIERYSASGRNYEVTLVKASMATVLTAIENSLIDRPVLDRTGLRGTYDIKMTYTPNVGGRRRREPDLDYIDIFTAVSQLGLKLVPEKAMIDTLVVDHIEQPSAN